MSAGKLKHLLTELFKKLTKQCLYNANYVCNIYEFNLKVSCKVEFNLYCNHRWINFFLSGNLLNFMLSDEDVSSKSSAKNEFLILLQFDVFCKFFCQP